MWAKVRKFGLSHCDLPTMLWNLSVFLRMLALNIDNRNTKPIPILAYVFLAVSVSCYIFSSVISMLWFVFWKCHETGDVIAAIIVFSLGIASLINVVKLFFMFLYKKAVKNMVEAYLKCDALVEPGTRFAINILKTLRVVKKSAMVYWITVMCNGCIYNVKPINLPGEPLIYDLFIYFDVEPMFKSLNYKIAMLASACGVMLSVFAAGNITGFLIITAGYIEAQMLALGEELNFLWDDANEHYNIQLTNHASEVNNNEENHRQITLNDYIKIKLETIVRSHTNNIMLLQQLESIFRGVIATEFVFLVVSLIAALLGGLENTYLELPFLMLSVTIDCWTGQKLVNASNTFRSAVYNCKWENFDKSNMKTVLLMLVISKKEMQLSAGGVTTLNLQCLMTVIRAIYSAYTTLGTTM